MRGAGIGVFALVSLILLIAPSVFASVDVDISDFRISGSKTPEIYPTQKAELTFTIKNNDARDLNNVNVLATLENGVGKILTDKDGNEIRYEKTFVNINGNDRETASWQFIFPEDYDENYDYEIIISIDGQAKRQSSEFDSEDFELEKEYSIDVSRRKYEMSWVEFQVSKTEANCGDRVSLNYKIKNIGKDDEPGLYVEVI